MTDTKHPEATPQNLYQITGNVADMNTVLIERAELHRLQAENDGLRALASGGIDLFERYSTFKAKCEELEAMLDAVGAGGVGQSIKPQIQADTAQAQQEPVAWICAEWSGSGVPELSFDGPPQELSVRDELTRPVWTPLYTAPQPTENLRCKSTQKRLATLWGYVKKEPDHFRDAAQMVPARQPLTNEQIIAIADNARAAESGDAGYILPIAFARAIEAAVNWSQQ